MPSRHKPDCGAMGENSCHDPISYYEAVTQNDNVRARKYLKIHQNEIIYFKRKFQYNNSNTGLASPDMIFSVAIHISQTRPLLTRHLKHLKKKNVARMSIQVILNKPTY